MLLLRPHSYRCSARVLLLLLLLLLYYQTYSLAPPPRYDFYAPQHQMVFHPYHRDRPPIFTEHRAQHKGDVERSALRVLEHLGAYPETPGKYAEGRYVKRTLLLSLLHYARVPTTPTTP